MGSSARKKREKKKDFQKTKLKVGKGKAKPANETDTKFRSKAIVLTAQSLSTTAPTSSAQAAQHISLLSARSRTDAQRRESLAFLSSLLPAPPRPTGTRSRPLSPSDANQQHTDPRSHPPLPIAPSTLLPAILPHLLSPSTSLRNAVLALLRALPPGVLRDDVRSVGMYVRAALTHLSLGVRGAGVEGVGVLIDAAGPGEGLREVAEEDGEEDGGDMWGAGEWGKLLAALLGGMGWMAVAGGESSGGWTGGGGTRSTGGPDEKARARAMAVLAGLLRAGLVESKPGNEAGQIGGHRQEFFPLHCARAHQIPRRMAAYAYLGLFDDGGKDGRGEREGVGGRDRDDRVRLFWSRYRGVVGGGIELARGEGGEVGRAAGLVGKVLEEVGREVKGMDEFGE